jgi:hypothetical protein
VSKSRVLIIVMLLLSATTVAQAVPITVPTDSELILNFDLTPLTPAPPYETLDFAVDIGGYAGQGLFFNLYTELDGQGTAIVTLPLTGGGPDGVCSTGSLLVKVSFPNIPSSAPVLDGLFSIGLRTPNPSPCSPAHVASATAVGSIMGMGSTPPVSGEVAIPAPEPGTLSLLGLGLAAVARRRRARPVRPGLDVASSPTGWTFSD